VEWNIAIVTAVNASVKKMSSANAATIAHPITMALVLVMAAEHAIADWPQRAVNAITKQDNANACQALLVVDAISASKDIGIMDQMDVHVRLLIFESLWNNIMNI